MYDKFREYMWYLLPAPLKMAAKKVNQWFIFLGVIGEYFDEVKEDLLRAGDETTIATCSDEMLQYHGEDRGQGLTRNAGESYDAFRSRIAMYDEVERMGGTRDGVLLAVNTLGYEHAEHAWVPELTGDKERWAEFYILIYEDIGDAEPTGIAELRAEVRDKKEPIAKDNYWKIFTGSTSVQMRSSESYASQSGVSYYKARRLDGSGRLDGSHQLAGKRGDARVYPDYNADVTQDTGGEFGIASAIQMQAQGVEAAATMNGDAVAGVNYWKTRLLSGRRRLDGSGRLRGTTGVASASQSYQLPAVRTQSSFTAELHEENWLEVSHTSGADGSGGAALGTWFYQSGRRLNGADVLSGKKSLGLGAGAYWFLQDSAFEV